MFPVFGCNFRGLGCHERVEVRISNGLIGSGYVCGGGGMLGSILAVMVM